MAKFERNCFRAPNLCFMFLVIYHGTNIYIYLYTYIYKRLPNVNYRLTAYLKLIPALEVR